MGEPLETNADRPTLFDRGMSARSEVLGAEHVAAAMADADGFDGEFQRLVTEYCWGVCWGDERLNRKTRSILNLGMTAASGRMHEFELHFRGALRNGLEEEELKAALVQIAVYCGIPAGVSAFRIAKDVLRDYRSSSDGAVDISGAGRVGPVDDDAT